MNFDNDESLKLSESTFTHFYLYKDKVINDDEYLEIVEHQKLNNAREYVLNILLSIKWEKKEHMLIYWDYHFILI